MSAVVIVHTLFRWPHCWDFKGVRYKGHSLAADWLLYNISSPFLWWSLRCRVCVVNVFIGAWNPSRRFLWWSPAARTLLQWRVKTILLNRHKEKYLKCSYKQFWFREVAPVSSALGFLTYPASSELGLQYREWIHTYWVDLRFNWEVVDLPTPLILEHIDRTWIWADLIGFSGSF